MTARRAKPKAHELRADLRQAIIMLCAATVLCECLADLVVAVGSAGRMNAETRRVVGKAKAALALVDLGQPR
jgi:hypothetical protein